MPCPQGTWVNTTTMNQWLDADNIVLRAEQRAQEHIHNAEQTIQKYWEDIEEQRAEQIQQIHQQCEQQILSEQIQWLVSAEMLQMQIITQLQQKLHQTIAHILQQWCSTQPPTETLIGHLCLQIEQQLKLDRDLTLTVHPDNATSLMLIAQTHGITLITDPNFTTDSAQLRSSRQVITLSLSRHLQQLLEWLNPLQIT
ncbi:MAG: hypothetical protein ACRC0Z_09830 [Plesiomonas sp.]